MNRKQYEFHSELPPERVRVRLSVYERRLNALDDSATSVQFIEENLLYE